MFGELADKCAELKEVASHMNMQINNSRDYLSKMGDDMSSSQSMLSSTMGHITRMLNSGSGGVKHMCYLVLFIVIIFIFIWKIVDNSYSN